MTMEASTPLRASGRGAPPPEGPTGGQALKRDFTLRSAFSLAFAYMSPIVCIYGVFAIALALVGPGFWLALPVAAAGQLLVAYALGEVASRYPYQGSLYAWAGRLMGPAYGWFTGWAYVWTVLIALVTVAVGATQFWGAALAIDVSAKSSLILGCVIVLAIATACNMLTRRLLRLMIAVSITVEVIASIGLGVWLLAFHHVNPISAIFENGLGAGGWSASTVLLAIGLAGWSFVGFESSGAIGEEVKDAGRNVPKALRYSLMAIAAIGLFGSLSLLLAVPDVGAVLTGADADPITTALTVHLGETATRLVNGMFALGFSACVLGLQTGISRVIWAFARDRALPASGWLSKLSQREAIPLNALAVTAVLPLPIFLLTGSNVYNVLVGYVIGGWYLTFALALVAAAIVRWRGGWKSGPFSLGRWSLPVLIAAMTWAVFEMVNISWPREVLSGPDWWLQWSVVIVTAVLGVLGALVYATVRGRMHLGEPTADTTATNPKEL
ncbi:APC family permease [Conexibacter woesei]|uniref:Amino acid permease-associated region n=1 Tax=Conexibacter woesei (strain DSM 14684 / CCUG 47730 / CIP 108061 / JCM 11494 / NBRC 100937 / ID131577) TaxID=469383 RepID=D3F2J7_CONWI|nr:APC family permease [Conexibacter woesei]ADB52263.1 amino acid permease-associated region [Conexibacter woesei DSM 14684]